MLRGRNGGRDMARYLLAIFSALALAACSQAPAPPAAQPPAAAPQQQAQGQPAQAQPTPPQSQALVGTWSTTVNWNLPAGLMIVTSFTADGRITSTTQNHQGQAFLLTGVYQYDAAQNALSYEWRDYGPKQTCIGGMCTPGQPPAPLGVVTTSTIQMLGANQFVASSPAGNTTYIRTNAAGIPIG
jgi:hypothetical protein